MQDCSSGAARFGILTWSVMVPKTVDPMEPDPSIAMPTALPPVHSACAAARDALASAHATTVSASGPRAAARRVRKASMSLVWGVEMGGAACRWICIARGWREVAQLLSESLQTTEENTGLRQSQDRDVRQGRRGVYAQSIFEMNTEIQCWPPELHDSVRVIPLNLSESCVGESGQLQLTCCPPATCQLARSWHSHGPVAS